MLFTRLRSNFLSRAFLQQLKILDQMALGEYLRYRATRSGRTVSLNLHGFRVLVRKGTPDLSVALSSLGREFEPLSMILAEDFAGIIIDGGGYIGTAALKLARLYPKATVITIEPSSDNLLILEPNVRQAANIHIVRGALSGASGERLWLRNRGTGAWGYTVIERPADRPAAPEMEAVEAVTLDDLQAQFSDSPIGILKLDIEGGEKALFDHSGEALRRIPVIFAELHERIVPGCWEGFVRLCEDRWLVRTSGEKYLALARSG